MKYRKGNIKYKWRKGFIARLLGVLINSFRINQEITTSVPKIIVWSLAEEQVIGG